MYLTEDITVYPIAIDLGQLASRTLRCRKATETGSNTPFLTKKHSQQPTNLIADNVAANGSLTILAQSKNSKVLT